jgi:nucleoside transporter
VTQTLNYETPPTRSMDMSVYVRLCVMMFLQFFVWGAWYVTASNYMTAQGFKGLIPWAYSVSPIAAIVAPLFVGMIADRFFATERVLAVMHLVGAIAIGLAPLAAKSGGGWLFIGALLVHMLCYMPTINLTNTISFRNLTNQETQFPLVRVFGTAGWVIANWTVSGLKADQNQNQFYLTAAAGLALAVFSLALPHTPPPSKGKRVSAWELLGLDALSMLRSRPFLVFMICAFLICIPLAVYYAYANVFVQAAGEERVAIRMSWGQLAEIVFMFLMPLFFAALGVKWMLAVGMLAWVVRYGLFAAAAPSASMTLIMAGILLHGICYDFFFVTGFIYTDKRSPSEIRGQAQGLLVLVTYGLGMLVGAQLSGYIFGNMIGTIDPTTADALPVYQKFWLFPCIFAAVIFAIFVIFFRDDTKEPVAGDSVASVAQ